MLGLLATPAFSMTFKDGSTDAKEVEVPLTANFVGMQLLGASGDVTVNINPDFGNPGSVTARANSTIYRPGAEVYTTDIFFEAKEIGEAVVTLTDKAGSQLMVFTYVTEYIDQPSEDLYPQLPEPVVPEGPPAFWSPEKLVGEVGDTVTADLHVLDDVRGLELLVEDFTFNGDPVLGSFTKKYTLSQAGDERGGGKLVFEFKIINVGIMNATMNVRGFEVPMEITGLPVNAPTYDPYDPQYDPTDPPVVPPQNTPGGDSGPVIIPPKPIPIEPKPEAPEAPDDAPVVSDDLPLTPGDQPPVISNDIAPDDSGGGCNSNTSGAVSMIGLFCLIAWLHRKS